MHQSPGFFLFSMTNKMSQMRADTAPSQQDSVVWVRLLSSQKEVDAVVGQGITQLFQVW